MDTNRYVIHMHFWNLNFSIKWFSYSVAGFTLIEFTVFYLNELNKNGNKFIEVLLNCHGKAPGFIIWNFIKRYIAMVVPFVICCPLSKYCNNLHEPKKKLYGKQKLILIIPIHSARIFRNMHYMQPNKYWFKLLRFHKSIKRLNWQNCNLVKSKALEAFLWN